jgi:hypothetical protein
VQPQHFNAKMKPRSNFLDVVFNKGERHVGVTRITDDFNAREKLVKKRFGFREIDLEKRLDADDGNARHSAARQAPDIHANFRGGGERAQAPFLGALGGHLA